jgi:predicted aminopeptidase
VLCVLALPGLAGCGTTYLLQAAHGQWQVMSGRKPIERLVADPRTDATLRRQLGEIQQARVFASRELGLPDNRSYTTYVDVGRPFVVWNVVATPEFSVEPLQWCFPVVGCLQYRGYFREAAARRYGDELRRSGHDVALGGVTAYSTLGRFADPVLSSMLRYGELDVIGTLFHELAHQQVYLPGDSSFNEAFAVTVEQEGLARWLRARGRDADFEEYRRRRAVQVEFVSLLRAARARLAAEFARRDRDDAARRAAKARVFADLEAQLRALQQRLGPARGAGIGAWVERGLNNAQLASVATYWDCVGGFEQVLAEQGGRLPDFYAEVRRLSRQDDAERRARLCHATPLRTPPAAPALRPPGASPDAAGEAAEAPVAGRAAVAAEVARHDRVERGGADAEPREAVLAADVVD